MEQNQTKLLIPVLRPLYEWAEPVSWLLVRLTVGLMIIPHGWPKVMAGIGPTAANALAKRGIEPAEPLAVILIVLETMGVYALLWVSLRASSRWPSPSRWQSSSISTFPSSAGRARLRVSAHVGPDHARDSLRGGGPYSLDRRLGREL